MALITTLTRFCGLGRAVCDCAGILRTLTRTVYALLGVFYLLVGVGSIGLPAGWISPRWVGDDVAGLYAAATPDSFLNHLTQEFGTLVIAVGWTTAHLGPRLSHRHPLCTAQRDSVADVAAGIGLRIRHDVLESVTGRKKASGT